MASNNQIYLQVQLKSIVNLPSRSLDFKKINLSLGDTEAATGGVL